MKPKYASRTIAALAVAALAVGAAAPLAAQSEKPRIAVLEFEAKADQQWYQWWRNSGAAAIQDVIVTELVKSGGKFRVIERSQLEAILREKNLALSGDVDASSAVKAGKLLGVKYLLTGAVTEYGTDTAGGHVPSVGGLPSLGGGRKKFTAAVNARLIDVETGEIVWADEARDSAQKGSIRVGGFGGGSDSDAMFDKVLKPVVVQLVTSLKAADI
jgi:curli biogenesis system outer membrane secretion channel CsgG